jgi:5-methylcytosine-specific restriction endonuclease McrA
MSWEMPKIHPRPGTPPKKKHKRKTIPKAVREQIWLREFGKAFEAKCKTPWCENKINVWDFHAGHNVPDSKGGSIDPKNLIPICSRCNLSMSDTYTFQQWAAMGSYQKLAVALAPLASPLKSWWCCF